MMVCAVAARFCFFLQCVYIVDDKICFNFVKYCFYYQIVPMVH